MHLVQLLLPITARGPRTHEAVHRSLRATLTDHFGGVTAYTRAPAEGEWKPDGEATEHDDVVMLEVVVETLDHAWWRALRERLEHDLAQEAVLVRALPMELL